LVLGVSGGFLLPFVKLFTNKKIIVSIDGIEWKRNKWSKIARWYLWAAEWVAVRFSHADIADNESIQDYTAIRYKTLSQIIEYGADHILKVKPTAADKVQYPFLNRPYAFTVCRIEPENNIHVVLEAFKQLTKHKMVMVGNWKGSSYGLQLLEDYKNCANIMMLDPIYDQRNLDMLRGNCTLYVHGHSAGGTNPSLVEAMFLGLPIFAYNVSYNRTTTEGKAKYFRHASELVTLVQNTRIAELNELAACMKTIANRRYTWKVIASRYRYLIMQVSQASVKNTLGQSNMAQSFSDNYIMANGMGHFLHQQHFYEKR
jgi:glycosyltransferase involved in cell wall biosynthesis